MDKVVYNDGHKKATMRWLLVPAARDKTKFQRHVKLFLSFDVAVRYNLCRCAVTFRVGSDREVATELSERSLTI